MPESTPPSADFFRVDPAHLALLQALARAWNVDYALLEGFFDQCAYQRLLGGQQLLSPGQENQYLYVLLSGLLSAHINLDEAGKGFMILPGEFVGEVSIVDNLPPTSYVSALEDSVLMCVHESEFWNLFILIPGVAKNLLQQMTKRTRARNLSMQRSLERSMRLEILDKELKIAQDLQNSMLPQQPFFPDFPRIEVDAFMKPAKEVGGDLYDAFALDEQRICLAIGDVAGKGIPAAMFMMRSFTVLRMEMLKTGDLQQTIRAVNLSLSKDNPQCMFVTLMICILDQLTGELQWVNGGHNPPLLGNRLQGFHYLPQPKGILVGVDPQADFQTASRCLQPGDLLLLYTDGVTEANNPAQQEFSESRLLALLNQQSADTANAVISGIWTALQDFVAGAEQSDDLTLLALRYH